MQCAIGRGAKGTGAYPGRDHRTGLLKAAAEGAVGEAEFWKVRAVNGATVTHHQVWLALLEQRLFYRERQQNANTQKLAGRTSWGKAKKSYPPGAACWAPSDRNCPGGSGSPGSSALLHDGGCPLAPPVPAPAGLRRGHRNGAAKGTRAWHRKKAGQGSTTAPDLEPLCKFTRGYGKTNMEEPRESGGGGG